MYTRNDGPGYGHARLRLQRVLGRWDAVPDPGWLRRNRLQIALSAPQLLLGVKLLVEQRTPIYMAVGVCFLLSLPLVCRIAENEEPRYEFPEDSSLRPVYYQVKLEFTHEDQIVGYDSGALWFENDHMRYQGFRTSFTVTPDEIEVDGSSLLLTRGQDHLEIRLESARTRTITDRNVVAFPYALEKWKVGSHRRQLEETA